MEAKVESNKQKNGGRQGRVLRARKEDGAKKKNKMCVCILDKFICTHTQVKGRGEGTGRCTHARTQIRNTL